MKIGIVVPFSWSFWGAVVEHAELQAEALEARGHEVRLVMGNDPPGQFTRALHPRVGRHGDPPPNVIPIGRSVIVPANGSLPNIILSPRAIFRIRRVLERERFDVLHLHEPMTPVTCVSVLAMATCPIVATHHASGELGWMKLGMPAWGFLASRIDQRIAVSERARDSAARWLAGRLRDRPERRADPRRRRPGRPGAHGRLRGPAGDAQGTAGAAARLAGDPSPHRRARCRSAAPTRSRCGCSSRGCGSRTTGIDILGFLPQEELTALLSRTKALVAPSLGGESFGMVLTRAFACALPVVASDIPGYREVTTPETSVPVAPDDPAALAEAVTSLLADEPRRAAMGVAARELALERYAWSDIARRLEGIYERAATRDEMRAA